MRIDELRLALAQPLTDRAPDPAASAERVVELTAAAAARGADLIVFPEGYPGPLRRGAEFDAEPVVAAAARAHGCGICWSRIEREADRWHIVGYLHDRDGRRAARYIRAHPATGDVHPTLSGVGLHPGDDLGLAEFHGVTVGLLICSELWIPEVARLLALRGAEVLLAPAGGGFGRVADNWRLMTRARAIENECYIVMTSHRFDGEPGAGLIAGPEECVASSVDDEVVVGRADLARARWLRARDDSMEHPKPFASLPGLLRARRPELYAALAAPQPDAYDYGSPPLTQAP
jgi:predicted amidohydrolase